MEAETFSYIKNNWQDLAEALSLRRVAHFCERLEFQARGAPHAYLLLWLEKPLPLAHLSKVILASRPPILESCPAGELDAIVTSNMVHSCSLGCHSPDPTHCKYCFPKPTQNHITQDQTTVIAYPRTAGAERLIEYSPALLMLWRGHARIQFFETAESTKSMPNSGLYILKYTMRSEPSFSAAIQADAEVIA
jgi:hypothetical protein